MRNLRIWGIPAYYDLAQAENRLMVEWVIQAEQRKGGVNRVGNRDIRYFLTELIHDETFQDQYDRIIIDAPPRLTSACIQSFCAAQYLLIPTVLDGLSNEAVGSFIEQIKGLRDARVCPNLKIFGVIPYVPSKAINFKKLSREQITDILTRTDTEAILFRDKFEIPNLKWITECAGTQIAYATNANNKYVRKVRQVFDDLGDEIDRLIEELRAAKI